MIIANVHQAKSDLSKLIEAALAGQNVIISKAGKPVVKVVKYKKDVKSTYGILKGKINVPENFNDEDAEINKLFYGE
jgi:prevent-host-death family protein